MHVLNLESIFDIALKTPWGPDRASISIEHFYLPDKRTCEDFQSTKKPCIALVTKHEEEQAVVGLQLVHRKPGLQQHC